MPLRDPHPIEITTLDGGVKPFILYKWPAILGRELVSKYPTANVPVKAMADYDVSEATMQKLLSCVGVELAPGNIQMLTSAALIDNHCGDWETLVRLEWEALRYNVAFFRDGNASTFLSATMPKLTALISPMLTGSLEQLLKAGKQPSET